MLYHTSGSQEWIIPSQVCQLPDPATTGEHHNAATRLLIAKITHFNPHVLSALMENNSFVFIQ